MEVWTEILDTRFNFSNIDIYQKLENGVLVMYEAKAKDGFVFYDKNANDVCYTEDENTGLLIENPIKYYSKICIFPVAYNINNLSLVSVLEGNRDE